MPATVWTSPAATLLSEPRRTRKEKGGRICEAPGAVKPSDRKRRQGVPAPSVFLGAESRRQAAVATGVQWECARVVKLSPNPSS